jgi:3-oxo-5-alpha-steroid 4-dehydrogenase 1
MTESQLYPLVLWGIFIAGAVSLVVLLWVSAPYGRHARDGWGPTVPHSVGWVIMELPGVVVFGGVYALGDHRLELIPLLFLVLWQIHYLNRTIVFPLRTQGRTKRMPLLVVLLAIGFNVANGYVNARWVSHLGHYGPGWATHPAFAIGLSLFVIGAVINNHSDHILFNLRRPGETGYKIPRGGMYRLVSAPNYLGELIQWTGWAVFTWSAAGAAFAFFTAANLVPRALTHHRWYRETFDDYPTGRRAILPFLL